MTPVILHVTHAEAKTVDRLLLEAALTSAIIVGEIRREQLDGSNLATSGRLQLHLSAISTGEAAAMREALRRYRAKPPAPTEASHTMSDLTPTVIIDTREQDALPIGTYPNERGTLTSGDYSFAGGEHLLSIERKSIADLVQSLTSERERFTRELERLRGYRFARLFIIGWPGQIEMGQYRGRTSPKAIMHSLYSIEAKYVPVAWARTPEEGAELVERWVFWFARSIVESAKQINRAAQ